jgi:hypothetical protein
MKKMHLHNLEPFNYTEREILELIEIAENYIKIRRNFDLSVTLIIVLFGLFGNASIIGIMCFNKSFLKLTTTIYLIALAISDSFVLVFENLIIWIDFLIKSDGEKIQTITDCKIYYIYYVAKTVSAWLIVSICVDRFLIVYFPLMTTKYLTKKITIMRIIILTIISILINLHYVILIKAPINFEYDCVSVGLGSYWNEKIWPIINTLLYSVIPSLLLLGFYILIIYKLAKMKKKLEKVHNHQITEIKQYLKVINSHKQLNITVFTICLSFFILTLPSNIYTILNNQIILNGDNYHENFYHNKTVNNIEFLKTRNNIQKVLLIDRVLEQLMNVYHAINFILYILTSTVFRKEIANVFLSVKNLIQKCILRFL